MTDKVVMQPLYRLAVVGPAAALWMTICGSALATDAGVANPSLSSRWVFTAGAVLHSANTEVSSRLKGSMTGGRVDLSTLGVDEDYTSPFFKARYRPNTRWRFDVGYQRLHLDGQRGATYDIEFGAITIPAGWDVSSNLSVDIYSGSVGYAFYRTPDTELGAMIGLHVLDAGVSLRGTLLAGNATLVRSEGIDIVVPAPTVGLFGSYAITDRLAIEGSAEIIGGNIADYSGHFFVASAALTYWILPNAALSVGYKHFDAKLKYDDDRRKDVYDVGFGGPFATVSIGF